MRCLLFFCGSGRIRTDGTFQYGSFQDFWNKPLSHASFALTNEFVGWHRGPLEGAFFERGCKITAFF